MRSQSDPRLQIHFMQKISFVAQLASSWRLDANLWSYDFLGFLSRFSNSAIASPSQCDS